MTDNEIQRLTKAIHEAVIAVMPRGSRMNISWERWTEKDGCIMVKQEVEDA